MTPYFVLSPRAAEDLVEIWHYIKTQSSLEIADRTKKNVRFFAVYSYLIVYRVQSGFIEIASVLHGRRDVGGILHERL